MGDLLEQDTRERLQARLDLADGGAALEPVSGRRSPTRTARDDARRVVQHLAARGRLPVEWLQDVYSAELQDLCARTGLPRDAAFRLQVAVAQHLVDYTAHKLATVDLTADPAAAGAAAGGWALGHFLAASAVTRMVTGQAVDGVSGDRENSEQYQGVIEHLPDSLPEKGTD